MRFSSTWLSPALFSSLGILLTVGTVPGQSLATRHAALPHLPYWWSPQRLDGIEAIPLLWFNEVDGGESGCCVVGAASRHALGDSRLWVGLAFGTRGAGGQPAALELALELERAALTYRQLHGRNGIALVYAAMEGGGHRPAVTVKAGSTWLEDARYLEEVVLFDCPADAPAAPCQPQPTPHTWSAGRDNSIGGRLEVQIAALGGPRLAAWSDIGLQALGGDHEYLRLEGNATFEGGTVRDRWWLRLSSGWVSGDAPQQRRFLLEGADPVTRWLNPYLDVDGALLSDIPYFVPGGPHVRAYGETSPLVKSYLGLAGRFGHRVTPLEGLWGEIAIFGEAAWTPSIPDRLGPAALEPGADVLLDWTKLRDGEGSPRGRFRASVLEVPEIWADAGVALTGAWDRVFVSLSFPLWANSPEFASDPLVGGGRNALAVRWSVAIGFSSSGRLSEGE